jgi:hypothetical protein
VDDRRGHHHHARLNLLPPRGLDLAGESLGAGRLVQADFRTAA